MLNEQLNIKHIKAKSHQLAIFSDKLEVDPLCIQTLPSTCKCSGEIDVLKIFQKFSEIYPWKDCFYESW